MDGWVFGIVFIICMSPIWGVFVWHAWDLNVRPRLIPAVEVRALADDLIARYGPRAEEIALIEEDRAWLRSETFQQGKWQRVRRELWRRHKVGQWKGPRDSKAFQRR